MGRLYLSSCALAQKSFPIWFEIVQDCVLLKSLTSASGLTREEVEEDPYLVNKRSQLVIEAASRLAEARMITFDKQNGTFMITDLGRIAAKYYIKYASIEKFNKAFRSKMTEADVLAMLSTSTEVCTITSTLPTSD